MRSKRLIFILLDLVLAVYIVFAVTSFNNPERLIKKCTKVNIDIADQSTYGFLDAKEVQTILKKNGMYPLEKDMDAISPRSIETLLRHSPFVNTAECYKTQDGHVLITITQRSPLVRIKSNFGNDYYLDENGGIMPNSKYTSDLIIVTGMVDRTFARQYIYILANIIMQDDFWRNQIEQINVMDDHGIELVPRVGDHIVFLGYLPRGSNKSVRERNVREFVEEKLDRLRLFYKYGLSEVGWNKYERIDMQFSNQIICKRRPEHPTEVVVPADDGPREGTDIQPATPTPEPKKEEAKKEEPRKEEPSKATKTDKSSKTDKPSKATKTDKTDKKSKKNN